MDFETLNFQSWAEEHDAFLADIRALTGNIAPTRIFEIGCGTGGLLAALGADHPDAALYGVDISAGNIAAAQALLAARTTPDNLALLDIMDAPARFGEMDLIVANSVFQLIQHDTDALMDVLADLAAPGASVVLSMPYACAANRRLYATRRVLRALRMPVLDWVALQAAKRAFPDRDPAVLRDRIPYMYDLPPRIFDAALSDGFARRGLVLQGQCDMPDISGKPKHRSYHFISAGARP